MRASHYARALLELSKDEPKNVDTLVERLWQLMQKNGHQHLAKKVLRAFTKMSQREEKMSTIEVITAVPIAETSVQKILKKAPFYNVLSTSHKKVLRTVDESVVGGVIVKTGSRRVDQSFKRSLSELYQHITK